MQKYKTVKKDYELLDEVICDRCGKLVQETDNNAYNPSWFSMKKGEAYWQYGGMGTYIKLDLCEPCANNLIQLIKENEYKVREEDWDY
jgi:hypothetical protein